MGKWILFGDTPCKITARTSDTVVTATIPDGGIYRELAPDSIEVFDGLDVVRVTMPVHNLEVGDTFDISRIGDLGGKSQLEGTGQTVTRCYRC